MNKKINLKITKRILFTLLVIAIFILGRNIPLLPLINLDNAAFISDIDKTNVNLNLYAENTTELSLFSLGISPWMLALIISRVIYLYKGIDFSLMSQKKTNLIQNGFILVIALLQAFAMLLRMEMSILDRLLIVLMLIAGLMILIWLGGLNSEHGFGSMVIILVISMVYDLIVSMKMYFAKGLDFVIKDLTSPIVIYMSMFILLGVIINIMLELSFYKIAVNRITIDNEYNSRTYLSFKLNPAGAMPYMFGMMLFMFPKYILMLLLYLLPNNAVIMSMMNSLELNHIIGVLIYILLLVILNIAFAFINSNPESIAKQLKNSGDYISGYYPGLETEKYLTKIVRRLSYIGAIHVTIFLGVPLMIAYLNKESMTMFMLPGIFMMLSGMMLGILSEISLYNIKKRYKNNIL